MSAQKEIVCIGAGYVGGPTMAVISEKCPKYNVTIVDINQARIDAWNSAELPIFEPGLEETVLKTRGRNLFFSTDVEAAIKKADIIFISVNTPTKTFGQGAGYAADLQYIEKCATLIRDVAIKDLVVVEKSTLPVRTAAALENILHSNNCPHHFEVISNPEFLAEGTAIQDLENPDRVLIGGRQNELGLAAIEEVAEIYANWVPQEKILRTNTWSSELSKLTANAFLAQRVSSINAMSAICEATEANVDEVARAIGADSRIGAKFLKSSVGFGGSCFQKDILNMVYIARQLNLPEVADYWEQVVKMNDYQKRRFANTVLSTMFNTVAGKKLTILGFAFKADTSDTRESPAIAIVRQLLEEQAEITITDPKALKNAQAYFEDGEVTYEEDPYKACEGSHALIILTDWQEFKDLDYEKIFKTMKRPAYVFDGRRIVDSEALKAIGYRAFVLGESKNSAGLGH